MDLDWAKEERQRGQGLFRAFTCDPVWWRKRKAEMRGKKEKESEGGRIAVTRFQNKDSALDSGKGEPAPLSTATATKSSARLNDGTWLETSGKAWLHLTLRHLSSRTYQESARRDGYLFQAKNCLNVSGSQRAGFCLGDRHKRIVQASRKWSTMSPVWKPWTPGVLFAMKTKKQCQRSYNLVVAVTTGTRLFRRRVKSCCFSRNPAFHSHSQMNLTKNCCGEMIN